MEIGELETKVIAGIGGGKFLLTPKQIVAIYDAGRERGSDEATAHEWGGQGISHRSKLDELENCLVWSDDCGLTTDMDYDQKKVWWAAFKAASEKS